VLVLSGEDVRALLDLDRLIDALAVAMADLSAGRASVPDRIGAVVPERDGALMAMPGYVPALGALAGKLVSLFPQNAGTAVPTHHAVIALFDPATGAPAALLDGTEITAARTGACSALSARLLAREDASVLAVLGTGVQARSHARALVRVRPIRELRFAGRDPARTQAVVAEMGEELGVETHAAASYEEALADADIVCATTHATEPVVRREWLAPGAHVASVGYNPAGREVDQQTVEDALVVVESRAAVLAPPPAGSNDIPDERHIDAEIGELVLGRRPGRTTDDQLTLYKSVGVAVQDAAATALVLAAARERS
jgi:ornithine cyclodeaminase/alanine dehydrogenase-like protein (mu-crystallin family)